MPEPTIVNLLTLSEVNDLPNTYKGKECDRLNCNRRFSAGCHLNKYIGNSFIIHKQNLPACFKAIDEDVKEWKFGRRDSKGNFIYSIRLPAKEE